jgi:predicted NAD/FAD-dependent oxidoreductase
MFPRVSRDGRLGPDLLRSALDTDQRLAACADWFVRGRVEGAFTSVRALAERILQET